MRPSHAHTGLQLPYPCRQCKPHLHLWQLLPRRRHLVALLRETRHVLAELVLRIDGEVVNAARPAAPLALRADVRTAKTVHAFALIFATPDGPARRSVSPQRKRSLCIPHIPYLHP